MTDRNVLSAAGAEVRAIMRRNAVEDQRRRMHAGDAWAPAIHDPELEDLADEVDEVIHSRRPEADDLAERLAGVLGEDWEPQ